jgi:hypothetical protein
LAQPASVTADITALPLTITGLSITKTKPYDGTTTAATTGGTTNKILNDTVSFSAAANYDSASVGSGKTITIVFTLSGTDAGNYTKPADDATINDGAITKAVGRTVSVPKAASKTDTSITVRAVTLQTPTYGQTAEYAISSNNTTPGTWQDTTTFNGLTTGNTYYLFARSKVNTNCETGTVQVSAAIKAIDDSDRKTVIDFEDSPTLSYTLGTYTPAVAVVTDPLNAGEKSGQMSATGYNQAIIAPINLPYALSNYDSVSFRFKVTSGNAADLSDEAKGGRSIYVYAANSSDNTQNGPAFKRFGFGNPASDSNNFVSLLVAQTPATALGDNSYKDVWTLFDIPIGSLSSTISNLSGPIYIAIGINHQNDAVYLFDDITFVLRDEFVGITPTTATFDKKSGAANNADITVTMTSNALSNITNNSTPLNSGTDYTVSGKTVTLKKEYLTAQADGTTTLTFNFSGGTAKTIAITISNSNNVPLAYDSSNWSSIAVGYPQFNLPAATPNASRTEVVNVNGANVLQVVINRAHDVVILPFNLGDKQLKDFQSLYVEIRRLGDNNDNGTKDANYKNFGAQIKANPTGSFGLGNSSSTNTQIANATDNPIGDNENWVTRTITLNSTANASTLTGTIELAFYAAAFTGKYQLRVLRLVPKS